MLNFVFTLQGGWNIGFSGIPTLNSSFLFGDGFFETIRMGKDNYLPLAAYHASRIARSADFLGFDAFSDFDEGKFLQLLGNLNLPVSSGDWKIKLLFYRGPGSTYVSGNDTAEQQILATCSAIEQPFFSPVSQIEVAEKISISPLDWGWMKSTSALGYVLAGRERAQKKADELLLCTPDGWVVEGSFTSICWRDSTGLCFTPRSLGGVDSCQRRFVENFLKENLSGFSEKKIKSGQLMKDAQWIAFLSGLGIRIWYPAKSQDFIVPDELRDLPVGGFSKGI